MNKIISDISDYIFISDEPEKVDAIFLPGGSHPEQPEYAAELYHKGYAKWLIPSGGVSVKRDKWPGVRSKAEIYTGDYQSDCAVNFDFDGFCEYDLEFREMLGFPPFTRLIAVHFRGEDENKVRLYGEEIVKELQPYILEGTSISAPLPAPVERIKGKYRYVVTIKGTKLKLLRQALRILALHRTPPKGVEMYVDVDAQNIM